VAILAITGASAPLFLSSSGNAAFQLGISSECPWRVGLQSIAQSFMANGRISGEKGEETIEQIDRRLTGAAARMPHVGPPQWQILTDTLPASANGLTDPVKFYARPGALENIRKLTPGSGQGVWIPDRTAKSLKLDPGDVIKINGFNGSFRVLVTGIYQDLSSLPEFGKGRSTFWCGQAPNIYPIGDALPPALLLADPATLEALSAKRVGFGVTATWMFPVEPGGLTLSGGRALTGRFDASKPTVKLEGFASSQRSGLAMIVDRATATVDSLRASVDTIALAGSLVALVVVAGAGVFWVHRRRSEAVVLSSKGFGPMSVALKVLLEAVPVAAIGAAAGWALGVWLVRAFGPTSLLDAGVPIRALLRVAWISGIGVLVLAAVAAMGARRDTEPTRAWRRSLAGTPWEIAVLLLAGASLYEVLTRGPVRTTPGGQPKVDVLILLFPVMFITGAASVAVRAIRRGLPLLRRAGRRWRPSLYLATRQLAGAPRIALGLLTATALSIGILSYSAVLSASVRATSEAKAKVFTGSDLSVTLAEEVSPPPDIASRATTVWVSENAHLLPQQDAVEVLGVDPATFARAAFWDPSFAGPSLTDLLAKLQGGGEPIPVLATEDVSAAGGTLQFRHLLASAANPVLEVPFRVVARVRAFPGMPASRSLVVATRAALDAQGVPGYPVLWVGGDPDASLSTLRAAKAPILSTTIAREAEQAPAFLALTWTFGFLQALGIVIGLIVVGGVLLYLEAYQRARSIAFALAGRMGLSRGAHRLSVGVELASMLTIGSLLGMGLAWGAARLVYGKLDLLPTLPPPPLFRTPLGLLGLTLLAVAVVSWLGAAGVQRAAERAHVTEVIRVAG
jgi:putative ABC transport system permease protein